jgi:hypothetical protein
VIEEAGMVGSRQMERVLTPPGAVSNTTTLAR